jgi:hypothetical protein
MDGGVCTFFAFVDASTPVSSKSPERSCGLTLIAYLKFNFEGPGGVVYIVVLSTTATEEIGVYGS